MNHSLSQSATACIICAAPSFYIKETLPAYRIHKCSVCRLEFCHPLPTAEQLDAFYADYRDVRAAPAVVEANAQRNIATLAGFGLSKRSRLLDYGSGQNAFCRMGQSEHWRSYDRYTGNCDSTVLSENSYDWITLWGVLEHVPDPADLLKQLAAYLKTGGFLALTTVSIETPISYQHKPPEHLTYWTGDALQRVLGNAGFDVVDYRPYVMMQNSDVYLSAVLRTVPEHYRVKIRHDLPKMVEVPTNEIFLVARLNRRESETHANHAAR